MLAMAECEWTAWRLPWLRSVTSWYATLLGMAVRTSQRMGGRGLTVTPSLVLDHCPCAQPYALVSVK